MKKLVSVECPNCGADLNFKTDQKEAFCTYCGKKMYILDDRTALDYAEVMREYQKRKMHESDNWKEVEIERIHSRPNQNIQVNINAKTINGLQSASDNDINRRSEHIKIPEWARKLIISSGFLMIIIAGLLGLIGIFKQDTTDMWPLLLLFGFITILLGVVDILDSK